MRYIFVAFLVCAWVTVTFAESTYVKTSDTTMTVISTVQTETVKNLDFLISQRADLIAQMEDLKKQVAAKDAEIAKAREIGLKTTAEIEAAKVSPELPK